MDNSDFSPAFQNLSRKLVTDFRGNNPDVTLKTFQDIHKLSNDITPHVSVGLINNLISDAPHQISHVLPWVLEHYPVSPENHSSLLYLAIGLKKKSAIDVLVDFGWTLESLTSARLLELAEIHIAQGLGEGEDLGINLLCPHLFITEKYNSSKTPIEFFLKACISNKGLLSQASQPSKFSLSWEDVYDRCRWGEAEKIQPVFNCMFADIFYTNVNTGMNDLKQFKPESLKMVLAWENAQWLDMKKVEDLVLGLSKKKKKQFFAEWFSQYRKHQLDAQTIEVNLRRSHGFRL